MSLISPKNFLAPITNIWHLATIAVVALLFGVYRMAGGGINVENIKNQVKPQYLGNKYAEEEIVEQKPVKKAVSPEKKTASVKPNDTFLDDLIAPDQVDEEGTEKDNSSPLDDIAKQLGVE